MHISQMSNIQWMVNGKPFHAVFAVSRIMCFWYNV